MGVDLEFTFHGSVADTTIFSWGYAPWPLCSAHAYVLCCW